MSRDEISPLLITTTPIEYRDVRGGGTGFFFNYQNETHLITNRHVVDPDNLSPDEVRIRFRNYDDLRVTSHHDVSLSGGDGNDWYGHPDEDVDLAAIPLNLRLSTLDDVQDQSHRTGSLAFTRDWYIYEKVDVNERVTVLGYPGEFRDQSTLYPVEREARISTPYGRDFDGEPVFVMDARMHPGTSGSPVIMRIGRLRAIDPAYPDHRRKPAYLLGIHSATYYSDVEPPEGEDRMWAAYESAQEGEDGGVMRYDLNKAWYPELLDDIFDRLD